MKKIIMPIITFIIVMMSSFCYANPVAVGDYEASAFTMFKDAFGETGSFLIGLVFTIVMCIVIISVYYKALDLKNKPENKNRAIIISVITCLAFVGAFTSLIIQKNKKPYDVVYNVNAAPIIAYNSRFLAYEGKNKGASEIRTFMNMVNAHNYNIEEKNVYGEFNVSGDVVKIENVRDSKYYTVSDFIYDVNNNGCVIGCTITQQNAYEPNN